MQVFRANAQVTKTKSKKYIYFSHITPHSKNQNTTSIKQFKEEVYKLNNRKRENDKEKLFIWNCSKQEKKHDIINTNRITNKLRGIIMKRKRQLSVNDAREKTRCKKNKTCYK